MEHVLTSPSASPRPRFRDLVLPKEHGSWSLAFEPLALSMLAAPSLSGGLLALAVASAFFCRRPLNIAMRDQRPERRAAAREAALVCGVVTALFFSGSIALAGGAWTIWLVPSGLAGAIFLRFDLRNAGREQLAEVAGSAAFGFLPAAMAVLAGWSEADALALAFVMVGRAVPTVLCVRAILRGGKTGRHRPAFSLIAAWTALAVAVLLARDGLLPWVAAALLALLALRAFALLVFPRPALRARTIGIIEAATGVAFVVIAAAAWNG